MSKNHPAPAAAAPAPAPGSDQPGPDAAGAEKSGLHGKYKFVRNEEFEDYLEAIGLGWIPRKVALAVPHDLSITQDGEKLTIKQDGREISFTVGEDFEDKQNGHIMKVTPHWDGDKLVFNVEPKEEGKGKAEKQIRELNGEELTVTHELGERTARRIFKKIPETK